MVHIIGDTNPTARKPHDCNLCGRTIRPGETYRRTWILGDDGPYTFKECTHCGVLCALYATEFTFDTFEGYTDFDVKEWEPSTPEAVELRRRFLARWCDDNGALYPVPSREKASA